MSIFCHVEATTSLTVPFEGGKLSLWQQIIVIECYTKDRSREIILKFIGK